MEEMSSSTDQQRLVASFLEIAVGQTAETARQFLKVGFRVQYSEDYQTLSCEDLKEFKQTGYAVADVLIDAALILGGDTTLKILLHEAS